MADTNQEREEKRVNSIAREYRKKGYHVIINPGSPDLPNFLRKFRPDLIAKNNLESVVVEVRSQTSLERNRKLEELAEVLKNQTGWRLELVVTNPQADVVPSKRGELPDQAAIQIRITQAESLVKAGMLEAAVLIAWSAAEAYFRLVATQERIHLEQDSTNYVLKKIYSLGLISKKTFDVFDSNLKMRNSIVHGFTSSQLAVSNVEALIREVNGLRRELRGSND